MEATLISFLCLSCLFICLISCGKQPLNRVTPQTEVIYSKDEPCGRQQFYKIQDSLDTGEDQGVQEDVYSDTAEPITLDDGSAAEDF